MKKKMFWIGLTMAALVAAGTATAARVDKGDNVNIANDELITENLYTFGGNVSVAGQTTQDLTVGGGSVFVSGATGQDLTVGGGNLILQGSVGDDLRAVGGTIMVLGRIGGEAVLAGGQITVAEGVIIEGDLMAAGGSITIDGEVADGVQIAGGNVVINGRIGGRTRIYAEKLTIGPRAVLTNGLIYDSKTEATISEQATIQGGITFNQTAKDKLIGGKRAVWPIFTAFWIGKLLMSLVLATALFAIFRKTATTLAKEGIKNYGWNLLTGFILIIMLPITAVIAFLTIIGVPIGVLILLTFITGLILASALAGIMLGTVLFKLLKGADEYRTTFGAIVVGVILLNILYVIPIFGWLICLLLFLPAFGIIFTFVYRQYRNS